MATDSIKEWENRIDLPKTPSQWRQCVSSETIEKPLKTQKVAGDDQRKSLHIGELVSSVHIRDLGGWRSASEIQRSHFLAAKILWDFKPVGGMKRPEFAALSSLSQEADEKSAAFLKRLKDWKLFRKDIETNRETRPELGKAASLGIFSLTRHQQLDILKQDEETGNSERPSPTISGQDEGSQEDAEMSDVLGSSGESDAEKMESSLPSLTSSADLTKLVSKLSDESVANPNLAKDAYTQSPCEDSVNIALIGFLSTITMHCPDFNLKWDSRKHTFRVQIGEALIRGTNDGRLCTGDGKDVYAVVEVKPFVLLENPEPVFMQMGIEMLAWILHCEKNGTQKKRYFLVSQHRHQVFVTVARYKDEYIRYLFKDTEVSSEESTFLKLTCFGPFNIFDSRSIFTLGRIILALSIQLSLDREELMQAAEAKDSEEGSE